MLLKPYARDYDISILFQGLPTGYQPSLPAKPASQAPSNDPTGWITKFQSAMAERSEATSAPFSPADSADPADLEKDIDGVEDPLAAFLRKLFGCKS